MAGGIVPAAERPVSGGPKFPPSAAARVGGGAPVGRPPMRRRVAVIATVMAVFLTAGAIVAVGALRGDDHPTLQWTSMPTSGLPANIDSIACPAENECWMASRNIRGIAHLKDDAITIIELNPDFVPISVACRTPDDCWAEGEDRGALDAAGEPMSVGGPWTLAYHYHGGTWTPEHLNSGGRFGCTPQACFQRRDSMVRVWDGSRWRESPVLPAAVNSVIVTSLSCNAHDDCIGFNHKGSVLRLTGGEWSATGEPLDLPDMWPVGQCPTTDDCIVLLTSVGGADASVVQVKDGQWVLTDDARRGLPRRFFTRAAFACTSITNCLIGRSHSTDSEPTDTQNLVDEWIWQWNGKEWRANSVSGLTSTAAGISKVSCASERSCYAIGYYTNDEPFILHGTPG
ncbi:hypothetical protein Vlu01_41980 [Micromonospora lutea]|uniref:Uncharacterized protein n=2 Tax=Micromonospora lutea TaxID=419825 RepID=A0ABQ4J085_9ACTN|nr:hypothetical protein Vlu01_41980 [Micromonospora lutea]